MPSSSAKTVSRGGSPNEEGCRLFSSRPDEEVGRKHLARYTFAADRLRGCAVIGDFACGIGYGTKHLAGALEEARLVGCDLSPQALQTAESDSHERCTFVRADVTRLPVPSASFDAIVSFETVEHLEDPEALLTEFKRVLRPEGKLVISTINREFSTPFSRFESRPFNRHHQREWDPGEFFAFLGRHFRRVERFSQGNVARPFRRKLRTFLSQRKRRIADPLEGTFMLGLWRSLRRLVSSAPVDKSVAGPSEEVVRAWDERWRVREIRVSDNPVYTIAVCLGAKDVAGG